MTQRNERIRFLEAALAVPTDDCLIWPYSLDHKGYGRWKRADGTTTTVHVVVLEQVSPRPSGAQTRHTCGEKRCFNPRHLIWGTAQQNADDRERDGNTARGVRNGRARLTVEQVCQIRGRDESPTVLAAEFGVHAQTVTDIRRGRTWRSSC